jgi:hypothetical protein
MTKNSAIGASCLQASGGSTVGLVTTFSFRLVVRLEVEVLCQDAGDVARPVQDTKDLDAVDNWPIEDHVLGEAIDGNEAQLSIEWLIRLVARTQAGHPG